MKESGLILFWQNDSYENLIFFPLFGFWFKHILLARTVDIIKQMLTVLKLQGLEWKQHAYIIPFLITNNIL